MATIQIDIDLQRAALVARLAATPAADWRLTEDEAGQLLTALQAPGWPPETVQEFNRLVVRTQELREASERHYKRTRFVNRQLITVHGLLALVYGASFAANGRLADLFCTVVWIACVAMHWVTHRRYMRDDQ